MSRSNPTENNPNPSRRWFEWNGEAGTVRYYDKEAKKNVEVGSDFTFILLDQLGTVQGWHNESDSGIYANEVKDTRQEPFVVKAFKGGVLVEGIYRDIRDSVKAMGGQFVANCYIAFKDNGALSIGSIRFKGAALHAWAEFSKENRADLYKKAVRINGFLEGKKGRIVFRVPQFFLTDISPETDRAAFKLDEQLQQFLDGYFKRTKRDQVEDHEDQQGDDSEYQDEQAQPDYYASQVTDDLPADDIPF